MNDESTSGSTAGGGGMNGMEQPGRENNDAEPYSEPDYIPLSTKPRQMPGGGGDDVQDPTDGGNNDLPDGLSNGTGESGAQDPSSTTKNESTGGTA